MTLLARLEARLRRATERELWLETGRQVTPYTVANRGNETMEFAYTLAASPADPARLVTVAVSVTPEPNAE